MSPERYGLEDQFLGAGGWFPRFLLFVPLSRWFLVSSLFLGTVSDLVYSYLGEMIQFDPQFH